MKEILAKFLDDFREPIGFFLFALALAVSCSIIILAFGIATYLSK